MKEVGDINKTKNNVECVVQVEIEEIETGKKE